MRSGVLSWFGALLVLRAAPCSADVPPPAPLAAPPAPETALPAAPEARAAPPPAAPGAAAPLPPVQAAQPPPEAHPAPPGPTAGPPPATARPPASQSDPSLDALVHIAIDREAAWLEARSKLDGGPWQRLCPAPCDRTVRVEGSEFRVIAPGMTPSNVFAIGPGLGTARFQVRPGSATARTLGIVGLAAGLPITFAGMTLFGVGSLEDDSGLKTAGTVTLAVGAVAVVAALPLLLLGSTSVKDEERRTIAGAPFVFRF